MSLCRHRESETRVLVKLVDRGDEIIVDTSELLQLESNYCSIPVFAQPFRLHGFDESVRQDCPKDPFVYSPVDCSKAMLRSRAS